jgi:hypothetical protein
MAEIQLYMHPKRQYEILKEYVVKLIKTDGSELSGEKFKEKLTDIIQHNKNKNLSGDIPKSFLSGLNKSSEEALIKGVERAYAEIRLEAEYTQNHPNVQSVRQSNMSGMRNWVAQHRRTRNSQQHRNRANTMQRAHMANMSRRNAAASTIQRMMGRRRTHVSRTAARPPLPAIRSRRTRTRP